MEDIQVQSRPQESYCPADELIVTRPKDFMPRLESVSATCETCYLNIIGLQFKHYALASLPKQASEEGLFFLLTETSFNVI